MRLVITQNITLDGVVEINDQTGDWFGPNDGGTDTADVTEALNTMMARQDAALFGRATFEAMRGYWPDQTDDITGISDHLDTVDKYVVSTTMSDPRWANSTVLTGDLVSEVRALKQRPGNDLGVTGSISVCHILIAAGLVDEYRLFVYPTVVGHARRLFRSDHAPIDLTIVETRPFESGVVLLTYRTPAR